MKNCLFCESLGPYSTIEHIIPESLGNDELLLRSEVCDSCQSYLGKEVESFALGKTPIAFWRTYLGINTKKGQLPSVDLSQPKTQKGFFPATHSKNDNVGFTYHDDSSVSVDIDDPSLVKDILDGRRTQFNLIMTPKMLHMLGRFLCKVGIELVCLKDSDQARSKELTLARRYARFGEFKELWPIFHFSKGNIQDIKRLKADKDGILEKVDCFSFSLNDFQLQYLLFRFSMGIDNWIVCLNDPFPHPTIRSAFPDSILNLIWYSNDEWMNAR